MRPLRCFKPGTVWFVTNRCENEQFFLLPSPEVKEIVGGWFARALAMFGNGIEIFAFVVMSNHYHILLKDNFGQLSAMMWYFQTNVARALNEHWDRKGHVFYRRYDAAPVENEADFWDRFQYTLMNPVRANIVEHCSEWTGLSSYKATLGKEILSFDQFDVAAYKLAVKKNRRSEKKIDKKQFIRPFVIPIATPDSLKRLDDAARKKYVKDLIRSFEKNYAQSQPQKRQPVLGMEKALEKKHTDRPPSPSMRPRIFLFCADPKRHLELLAEMKTFTDIYKKTSYGFRKAAYSRKRPTVEWPLYSCPPGCMMPLGYAHAV